MSFETIIEISFTAILAGGLGTLFWARMNRLEAQIIDIRRTIATRDDVAEVKAEIAGMRQELAATRKTLLA